MNEQSEKKTDKNELERGTEKSSSFLINEELFYKNSCLIIS